MNDRAGGQVALVSMPFGNVLAPSMGLSLLKSGLTRAGIACRVHYFSLRFAQRTGLPLYSRIANDINPTVRELAGEWLFAEALFGAAAADPETYVAEVLRDPRGWITSDGARRIPPGTIRQLLAARAQVAAFLDECVATLLEERPAIVGFTSVFQQHVASLALARRLRAAAPDLVLLLGGANCEGVMGAETLRQFPFLDAVVSGEADLVFPELARKALAGERPAGLIEGAPVGDMNALPYPDFSDFFAQFNATRYRLHWQPRIFFETSRGCWWGEKQHCTFCGLNGQTMKYRSKAAGRALEELETLVARHPGCDIQVVDNILDMQYFRDFLPALAARRLGAELFYETKSNLRKDQVRLLRDAGVRDVQPGIESLSDAVLRLMRKGVTGLQNLQLLKWCAEFGLTAHWNILWGFPGEPAADYAAMARLAPLLTHLTPPTGFGGVRLDRFSPNYFDAARLGFTAVVPLRAYRYVYPLPAAALANLAYHFTFDYAAPQRVGAYVRPLLRAIRGWKRAHAGSALFAVAAGDGLVICDTRPAAAAPFVELDAGDAAIYRACDAVTDVGRLAALAADAPQRVDRLVAQGLMVRDGARVLALAIAPGEYVPRPELARRLARRMARPGNAPAISFPVTRSR